MGLKKISKNDTATSKKISKERQSLCTFIYIRYVLALADPKEFSDFFPPIIVLEIGRVQMTRVQKISEKSVTLLR